MNQKTSQPESVSIEESSSLKKIFYLQKLVGIFGLILILECWKLWVPRNIYPVVPFFSFLTDVPSFIHYLLAVGIVIFLVLLILLPASQSRILFVGFSLFSVASILLNQHRFQPWMYQFVIIALVLSSSFGKTSIKLLRIFVIGIYVYSAYSKMDAVFPDQTGGRILNGLFKVIDHDPKFMDPKTFRMFVYLFPAGELLTALLLCFRPTRNYGLGFSIFMHVVLILTFSPLGLNHQYGVLIWNGFFILQNIVLFFTTRKSQTQRKIETANEKNDQKIGNLFAAGLVGVITFLPLLEPWGYFDHWPAWGLYSSRQERISISIHDSVSNKLSDDLKKYLDPVPINSPWRRLRIHHWSLEEMKAPMYPQDRFQVGVALAIANRYELGENIRLQWEGVADRWSGKRVQNEFRGVKEIEEFAHSFRVNAFPSRIE